MASKHLSFLMSNTSTYFDSLEEVLKDAGQTILTWLDSHREELGSTIAFSRLISMTMKAMDNRNWFNKSDYLHGKLLWEYCYEGNVTMVRYMLSLPGIKDVVIEDGTTGFVMALATQNTELIGMLMASDHQNDIDPTMLIVNAIQELDRSCNSYWTVQRTNSIYITDMKYADGLDGETESINFWFRKELASILEYHGVALKPDKTVTVKSCDLNELYIEYLQCYPILSPDAEGLYPFNKQMDDKMKTASRLGKGCKVERMQQYIIKDICMENVTKSLPKVKRCIHKDNGRLNCRIMHDILNFASTLQEYLGTGPLREYGPIFQLVGSMAEGTRIGVANELDLGLSFQHLKHKDSVPFKVVEDPFSLKKAITAPATMEKFFDGMSFHFHKFTQYLLLNVEEAVSQIFEDNR